MNVQQNIERQEREFKELLQRVMREPLAPISDAVLELEQRLDQLEQLFREMREVDLSALSLDTEKANKQIRSLKSATEETPQAVRDAMQPLLEQLRVQLEQGTLHELGELVRQLAVQLEQASARGTREARELAEAVSASQGALQHGLAQLDDAGQSAWGGVRTGLGQLGADLSGQLAQQGQTGEQSLLRLHDMLNQHARELSAHAAAGLGQLAQEHALQFGVLGTALTQLQSVQGEQQQQLALLQQQQDAWAERLGEQLQRSTAPIRGWLVAAVAAATGACAGVIALLVTRL